MKYTPKYVEESENVFKVNQFHSAIKVVFQLTIVTVFVYFLLGLIVDFAVPYIPVAWENILADPIVDSVRSENLKSDKYDEKFVQSLVDSLASYIDKNDRKFKIMILQNEEINALAFPGSFIVVYTGLLEKIESENELALIMAHELGHFVARDHLRGLGRSFLFFMVSSILLGTDSSVTEQLMSSSGILQNTYSRKQEYAADQFALGLITKKYGHAGGATDFFKRLSKNETLSHLTQYLSTHPASKSRVEALENTIQKKGYKIEPVVSLPWAKPEA